MQTVQVTERALDALIPYARNPRTHSPEQITKIAASIAEFGWTVPILVDGHNGVIAGHGRLLAARQLGLTQVPVIELAHLSPAQKRAYVLADNRLALDAGWDEHLLALELKDLAELEIDLALPGFSDEDIQRLLNQIASCDAFDEMLEPGQATATHTIAATERATDAADEDVDDLTPPETPVSRVGDLWQLGPHRLLCADSADGSALAPLFDGRCADLVFTSPPYARQRRYATRGIADWDGVMQGVFVAMKSHLHAQAQILVNLGLVHEHNEWQPYWERWIGWMRTQGWRRFGWYVWDQSVTLPGDWSGRLAPRHEFIFHFNRKARQPNKIVPCKYAGQDTHLRADGSSTALRDDHGNILSWSHAGQPTQATRIPDSVIAVMRQRGHIGKGIDHPAVFPVGLPQFVMQAYSDPGQLVYDPFCGSGTSFLAGQSMDRTVYASECAPAYVDVALCRWQQRHPDIAPHLTATGQRFADVAVQRGG